MQGMKILRRQLIYVQVHQGHLVARVVSPHNARGAEAPQGDQCVRALALGKTLQLIAGFTDLRVSKTQCRIGGAA